jgi:hypothetical protein
MIQLSYLKKLFIKILENDTDTLNTHDLFTFNRITDNYRKLI